MTEGQHKLRVEATGERDAAGKMELCKFDAAQVVVYHNRYAITEITPEESTLTLTEGAEHELAFDVKPSYASKEDVTITSSDKDIVEVTEDGKLLAEKVGEATITLASEKDGKSATVKVKVTEGDRELGGTIVDSNLQYPTADKYETVKSMSQRTSETLSAWKNDTAVSQISLYTKDVRVKNVSVEVSDFKAEDRKKQLTRKMWKRYLSNLCRHIPECRDMVIHLVQFQKETEKRRTRYFIRRHQLIFHPKVCKISGCL